MTLFIRNQQNETIVDTELYRNTQENCVDISVAIDIVNYSRLLLDTPDKIKPNLIIDFDILSELRGYLWEVLLPNKNQVEDYQFVYEEIKKIFLQVCERYNLGYVED